MIVTDEMDISFEYEWNIRALVYDLELTTGEAFSIKISEIELIDLTNGDCDNSFSGADIDAIKALFAIGKF